LGIFGKTGRGPFQWPCINNIATVVPLLFRVTAAAIGVIFFGVHDRRRPILLCDG
jgi:hypothetical protein